MMSEAFLITGRPGIGKTTLVKRIVEKLPLRAGGFYTEELREGGSRIGFKVRTLDGKEAVLAKLGLPSRYNVGRYGVDLQSFEAIGVEALRRAIQDCQVIVVDEIGNMELCSKAFMEVLEAALQSEKLILGTILERPHPWADRLKARSGVVVLHLTEKNRQAIEAELLKRFGTEQRGSERTALDLPALPFQGALGAEDFLG